MRVRSFKSRSSSCSRVFLNNPSETFFGQEMLWHESLIVDLDPIVHNLLVKSLVCKVLNLTCGEARFFISQERVLRPPGKDCCGWSFQLMPTHVEPLVFFIHESLHFVEVRIGFIHPWVSSLPQCCILLVLLSRGSLRDLALHSVLETVQIIQS